MPEMKSSARRNLNLLLTAVLCVVYTTSSPVYAAEMDSPFSQSESLMSLGAQAKNLQPVIRQRQWKEADRLLQELTQEHPNNPAINYWKGVVRFQLKDPVGAIVAFRTAERLGLNTVALHKSLGLSYYLIHQYIVFRQEMKEAIQADPSDAEPFYYLGRYEEVTRDNFSKALELFEKSIELNPDGPKALYHEGYCLQMLGRMTPAQTSYEKAIRLIQKDGVRFSWPYQGMASILLTADPERALNFAQQAVELDPGLDSNHLILARIDERLGKVARAIQELQVAVRLNPTNSAPHYSLFRLYLKTANPKQAQAELKTFKELNAVYGSQ